EVKLALGEPLLEDGLVRPEHRLELAEHGTRADGATLVATAVLVGDELAVHAEHADLDPRDRREHALRLAHLLGAADRDLVHRPAHATYPSARSSSTCSAGRSSGGP